MTREEEFSRYVDASFSIEWIGNLGLALLMLGVCGPVAFKTFSILSPAVADLDISGTLLVLVMFIGIVAGVGLLWLEDQIIQRRFRVNA